jgi:hypothetical protein
MRRTLLLGTLIAATSLAAVPAALASGGVNSGGVNSGGVNTGGGGSTTPSAASPCAQLSASGSTVNQGGVTSVKVSGTVTSCSSADETLYVQIEDASGQLATAILTPPNTAGGACYICDSILGARKAWSFSRTWPSSMPGATYPLSVTVLHRVSLDVAPVTLAATSFSVTDPIKTNA